jgi:hypothetical protein
VELSEKSGPLRKGSTGLVVKSEAWDMELAAARMAGKGRSGRSVRCSLEPRVAVM